MRHTAAALAATAAVLLPAAPARACTPSHAALTAPDRAVAGGDVRLSGEAHVYWCQTGQVTATPQPEPRPTSGVPLVTLPPLAPVASVRAQVEVTLKRFDGTGPARTIAVVLADPAEPRAERHSFAATVRVPADVAPARYVVEAKQRDGVLYGTREVTVLDRASGDLAATGGDTRGLLALALVTTTAGAGALAAGTVASRRSS